MDNVLPDQKKEHAQYFTPLAIAEFMANQVSVPSSTNVNLLDAGAGTGVLACALIESLSRKANNSLHLHLHAYEIDTRLLTFLDASLRYAQQWLGNSGHSLSFDIKAEDFVLKYGKTLNGNHLFENMPNDFDIAISNPPYFKLAKSDARAQNAKDVVHGQPNIYALFMASCAQLLKESGELVVITPRSYATGSYFDLFRKKFFSIMRPSEIHIFDSRRDAFKQDKVLQENIILKARRETSWARVNIAATVQISISSGLSDLNNPRIQHVPMPSVWDVREKNPTLHVPAGENDSKIIKFVRSWSGSMQKLGLCISTGPIVPFRNREWLSSEVSEDEQFYAPLFWLQNVRAMDVIWPLEIKNKKQKITIAPEFQKLLVTNRNYVLMRRFSAKEEQRRIVAAPYLKTCRGDWLGIENHLNYIYCSNGEIDDTDAIGLAALLNSKLVDSYFRITNGTTQVNASEIRNLPLPEMKILNKIGKSISRSTTQSLGQIDDVVKKILNHPEIQ
jgi:adenine-specific DNA-methyltransferase